jgi:hypothetical protein
MSPADPTGIPCQQSCMPTVSTARISRFLLGCCSQIQVKRGRHTRGVLQAESGHSGPLSGPGPGRWRMGAGADPMWPEGTASVQYHSSPASSSAPSPRPPALAAAAPVAPPGPAGAKRNFRALSRDSCSHRTAATARGARRIGERSSHLRREGAREGREARAGAGGGWRAFACGARSGVCGCTGVHPGDYNGGRGAHS